MSSVLAVVIVHIDLEGDRPHASSLVALAAGRHVASSWGATLYAALIVRDAQGLDATETTLARSGADKIVVAVTDAPLAPLWAMVGNAWQGVLDHLRPRLVLFGADAPSAAELAPRTGARIGARLLTRARALGLDDVELRDRDGGYARVADSGAAVALIGRADPIDRADDDVDLVVLNLPGGVDPRLELATETAAEIGHSLGAVVALGDDVVDQPQIARHARQLANLLGAQLIGSAAAARAGAIEPGAVVEPHSAMAPELLIAVGAALVEPAGASAVVKIGAPAGKLVDGALLGPVDSELAELVKRLEAP
ncbi:MAG TPA: hypothetical protein VLX92_22115 [Kofleriaceae bacterium]|nr:hypothetical protein [Kofleriaceae bacterium]